MGFKFNSTVPVCVIEIEDDKFTVEINARTFENILRSREMLRSTKSTDRTEGGIIKAADSAIDTVLGKDSAEKIFLGRAPDAAERCRVLGYIYTEITMFVDKMAGGRNVSGKAESTKYSAQQNY